MNDLIPTCDEIALLTGNAVRPPCTDAAGLGELFSKGVALALIFATLLSFVYLIVGGFKFILSAGDKERMANAGRTIVNAIVGLFVVFASFIIMQILGQILGFNFSELQFPILNPPAP